MKNQNSKKVNTAEISNPSSPLVNAKKDIKAENDLVIKIVLAVVSAVMLILLVIIVWFFTVINLSVNNIAVNGEVIEVNSGNSIEQIADNLSKKHLIVNKFAFIIYAKFGTAQGHLVPGPYLVKPTSTIREIINNMHTGKTATSKITFPEGITVEEMAKRWQAAGYGSKQDYLEAAKKLAKQYDFIPEQSKQNPEGYLFPSTYKFRINSSADTLVKMQYEQFQKQALPVLNQKNVNNLSYGQILTLASIVEREALTQTDRKLVAGVFINRLNQNMNLQSDVTVNYATNKTVTAPADIEVESPYNTYKVSGLPPTPINNPSLAVINAVVDYTPNNYLYFLAGKDGKVYYAQNYPEHVENIKNHL